MYRLHREKEALEVLKGLSEKGRKTDHLEAQIVSNLIGFIELLFMTTCSYIG